MASLERQLEENERCFKDIVSDISRQLEENARCLQDSVNHISRLSRHLEVFEKVKGVEEHQLSAIFDDVNEAAQPEPQLDSAFFTNDDLLVTGFQPEPKRPSFLHKSLAWDSAFFTSDGLLDTEELFALSKGFQPEPKRPSFLHKSLAWDSAFFTSDGLLDTEDLFALNKGFQPEPKRPSFLLKSLVWDGAFFTSDGLLDPEELFALNKGFLKTPLTHKDGKRSKLATKIGGSQTHALSKDSKTTRSKRTRPGGLPKSNAAFTTPTTKNTHCSNESSPRDSSQKLSKSKVNHKGVKLSSSPSSVLCFPLSSSPASSDDGWLSESLRSTTITHQSPIPVLNFHNQNSKQKKITSQNATIQSSRLRMPSPRLGFFDMVI